MQKQFISAIIVAAGSSSRMGEGIDKQMVMLGALPVLAHSIRAFEQCASIDEIIVVTKSEHIMDVGNLAQAFGFSKLRCVVAGGATRQESVSNGISACGEHVEYYLIHDGARPLVKEETINAVIENALIYGAAAAAVPVKDTVKRVGSDMKIENTVDRASLYLVQTPQMFAADTYRMSLKQAIHMGLDLTDDCQLFERTGHPVYLCEGDYGNIKLTTPEDIAIARALMRLRELSDE